MNEPERFGRDVADDLMLDALLLALRMHVPKAFNATHENFIAMTSAKRSGLPDASAASFDARQKQLLEKMVLLRKLQAG